MKRNLQKYGLLAFLWLAYTLPAFADPNDPDSSDDPQAPIDNWVIVLMIAGMTLGVYFALRYRNKQIV